MTGCQAAFASSLLVRLETVGLIEKLPPEDGQLRRYYRRVPSAMWEGIGLIIEEALKEPPAEIARLNPRP
jgi:hypothetical protein